MDGTMNGSIGEIEGPNHPVHLTPEAVAFFALAISEQNFAFAKFLLASGAGDRDVLHLR